MERMQLWYEIESAVLLKKHIREQLQWLSIREQELLQLLHEELQKQQLQPTTTMPVDDDVGNNPFFGLELLADMAILDMENKICLK